MIFISNFTKLLVAGALPGVLLVLGGCGDSDNSPSGGGSGGGASDGAGGQGGQPACEVAADDECAQCMAGTCCDAYAACEADEACWGCVTGTDEDACGSTPASHELQTAYLECVGGPCNDECIGASGSCEGAEGTFAAACDACVQDKCCDELGACYAHEGCWVDCVTEHNSEGCHEPNAHALYYAFGSCVQSSCSAECSSAPDFVPACDGLPEPTPSVGSCIALDDKNLCNPITNEGCTQEGYSCDVNPAGDGFQCFEPPNTQGLCEACGAAEGYCQIGHTCAGSCVRFCCDQADCGENAVCDTKILSGLIGLCVEGTP